MGLVASEAGECCMIFFLSAYHSTYYTLRFGNWGVKPKSVAKEASFGRRCQESRGQV